MTYAEIIRIPVADEAGAMAFLAALVGAGKCYHLDDSPHEIACFAPSEANLVEKRVGEIYSLNVWTFNDCPIGRMMKIKVNRPVTEATTAELTERFIEWRQWEDFGDVEGDALELLRFAETTQAQRDWLAKFCEHWDAVQAAEDGRLSQC